MSNARKTVTTTKSATVRKMLRRASGATLAEITTVTTWQPHSARALILSQKHEGWTPGLTSMTMAAARAVR